MKDTAFICIWRHHNLPPRFADPSFTSSRNQSSTSHSIARDSSRTTRNDSSLGGLQIFANRRSNKNLVVREKKSKNGHYQKSLNQRDVSPRPQTSGTLRGVSQKKRFSCPTIDQSELSCGQEGERGIVAVQNQQDSAGWTRVPTTGDLFYILSFFDCHDTSWLSCSADEEGRRVCVCFCFVCSQKS